MAFIKTSIALGNLVTMTDEDVRALEQEKFPLQPEVGDFHKGFVWDGGAWVTVEVWTARQNQTSAEG